MSTKVMGCVGSIIATIFLAVLFVISADVYASEHIRGHMKKDGKYVAPHNRTNANKTQEITGAARATPIPTLGSVGIRVPKNK